MKIIDAPVCLRGFVNENEFHFLLVFPLYNKRRVTLQNAVGVHSTLYPKNPVVWR